MVKKIALSLLVASTLVLANSPKECVVHKVEKIQKKEVKVENKVSEKKIKKLVKKSEKAIPVKVVNPIKSVETNKNIEAKFDYKEIELLKKEIELLKKSNTELISNIEEDKKAKPNLTLNTKTHEDILYYVVESLNKITQKIDSIENNVIEYKYNGNFDPSEYAKYKVTSKMLVELNKNAKIINVYTKGSEIIGKVDGKSLITSNGSVDINSVELIKE